MEMVLLLHFWVSGLPRIEVWGPYHSLDQCLAHARIIVTQRLDPQWHYTAECLRLPPAQGR